MATRRPRRLSSGPSARVVLNRSALNAITLIVADGFQEAGRVIVERASADAPDSPYDPYPTGEGLPKQGGVLSYAGNRKVGGWHIRGGQPPKPRAARTITKAHSVTAVVGFGFPARFAEQGTIHTPAQPFLAPARDAVGRAGIINIVGDVVEPRLKVLP